MFAATAGPRRGFGHLVRCGVLADALGVNRVAVLRTESATTTRVARRLGWQLRRWPDAVNGVLPELLIVDDPSPLHTARWVRRARRLGIPVASIHDGRSFRATSDLVIDGSAVSPHHVSARRVAGPAFAVLRDLGLRLLTRSGRQPLSILVALGGGVHVKRAGARIAAAIVRRLPHADVSLAAGFSGGRLPRVPAGCRWIAAPGGLARALSEVSACVVSGGVTLYEACALGTPTVAIAVVPAQRPAVRAVVRANAALTASLNQQTGPERLADLVCRLLEQPVLQRALSRNAQRLVDGRGTARVVARLTELRLRHRRGTIHAVA
jgi:spore coat polysaccharide biosynthesis predicted glycosyltransferase SpsG